MASTTLILALACTTALSLNPCADPAKFVQTPTSGGIQGQLENLCSLIGTEVAAFTASQPTCDETIVLGTQTWTRTQLLVAAGPTCCANTPTVCDQFQLPGQNPNATEVALFNPCVDPTRFNQSEFVCNIISVGVGTFAPSQSACGESIDLYGAAQTRSSILAFARGTCCGNTPTVCDEPTPTTAPDATQTSNTSLSETSDATLATLCSWTCDSENITTNASNVTLVAASLRGASTNTPTNASENTKSTNASNATLVAASSALRGASTKTPTNASENTKCHWVCHSENTTANTSDGEKDPSVAPANKTILFNHAASSGLWTVASFLVVALGLMQE